MEGDFFFTERHAGIQREVAIACQVNSMESPDFPEDALSLNKILILPRSKVSVSPSASFAPLPRTGEAGRGYKTFIFDMVKIRLRREGSKGRPYYKIVVADGRARREGAFIEMIGNYDPLKEEGGANIDLEKADEWISKGAQPSETVLSIIKKARRATA